MTEPFDPFTHYPSETLRAAQAFRDYALMGAVRSIRKLLAVYNQQATQGQQKPPTISFTTLEHWSSRYDWQERVHEFDRQTKEADLAKFEADRNEWRTKRLQLLQATFGKAVKALNIIDPKDASWSEVLRAVEMVTIQLREEYGDKKAATALSLDLSDPNIPLEVLMRIRDGTEPLEALVAYFQAQKANQ